MVTKGGVYTNVLAFMTESIVLRHKFQRIVKIAEKQALCEYISGSAWGSYREISVSAKNHAG